MSTKRKRRNPDTRESGWRSSTRERQNTKGSQQVTLGTACGPLVRTESPRAFSSEQRIVQRDGITYELDLTEYIDRNIHDHGCFEPSTTAALAQCTKRGMTVLDIGANIGAHTFKLAQHVGPSGRVLAFEPMGAAFNKLRKNAELNPSLNNLSLHRMALGAENGTIEADFNCSWPLNGVYPKVTPEPVPVRRLDDLLAEMGIDRVDLVKLDVDGFEHKILQGAARTLRQLRPLLIMELCSYTLNRVGDSVEAMLDDLLAAGYEFFFENKLQASPVTKEDLLRAIPANSSINIVAMPLPTSSRREDANRIASERTPPRVGTASSLDTLLSIADASFARADWPAARNALKEAAAIAPDNSALLAALGGLHFQLKEYSEAAVAFTQATRLSPKDADLQTKLAVSLLQSNQFVAAETALQRSLELRADDPTALKLLADCHRARGLHRDAALIYGKLIGRHPDQVGVLLALAKCFFELGDLEGSRAAVDEVLKIEPANETALANLALLDQPVRPSANRNVRVVDTIEELKQHYGLSRDGCLGEEDLDLVESNCDLHSRKRRDAEVLCTLAANATGDVLELGTSHGRGAFKLATNLATGLRCHTVNILPEQHDASGGKMVTHLIAKDAIGSFYRERGVKNVEQYYANTARWEVPAQLQNLSLIFIDAAHDEENVYLDSKLVWGRLAPGGFLVWHDFSPFSNHFDWIAASMRGVERFRREYGLENVEVVNLRHSWCGVLRKPDQPRVARSLDSADNAAVTVGSSSTRGLTPQSLRYAVVYPWYSDARRAEEDAFAATVRGYGYDVEAIGLPCPGGWWQFPKLNAKWQSHARDLMTSYEQLAERLRTKDVLIASGGPMLHPEFIRQLSTFNVWVCSDDPESSAVLSRPAAPAFDFAFPINIACVDEYRRWGCARVDWLFPPVRPELSAPELTEAAILNGQRDLDLVLLCERVFNLSNRAQRVERLVREFPQAHVRGPGWPEGPVSAPPVYRRARIGWNLHNSSGPCNTRTTMLPAFGVLQICDNKANLAKMFALDREVVGFDSIEECIEKTRYYLAHDDERRTIAAAGWKRVHRDYTLERWWDRLVTTIFPAAAEKLARDKASLRHVPCAQSTAGSAKSPLSTDSVVLAVDAAYHASPVAGSSTPDIEPELPALRPDGEKPRVLLLVDRRNWAYDTAAQAIAKRLADEFQFRIAYVRENPDLSEWAFDLIYVFFWGETYHQKFVSDPRRVLKEISSHRWATEAAYGRLTAEHAAARYLSDAGTLTATSRRLQSAFSPFRQVHWCPNGFEATLFTPGAERTGPLRIGWAGNCHDPCKGLIDVLQPAAGRDFELLLANGDLDAAAMAKFYRSIDVLCVASTAEGEPLTLVEGMASGVFPVVVDVGIVPELVRHREDGLIVSRDPAAFRAAFQWCRLNVARVRAAGAANSRRLATQRRWEDVAVYWRRALRSAYRGFAAISPGPSGNNQEFLDRNLGVNLGQWPARAHAAAKAVAALSLPPGASLVDMGCGHQTLKSLLPSSLNYVPIDRLDRGPGVTVMDFSQELPATHHAVATFLGVFEYFADPGRLIRWAAKHVRYLVVSYNDCSSPARRQKQHWQSTLTFAELEASFQHAGGLIRQRRDLGQAEYLYVVEFGSAVATSNALGASGTRSAQPRTQTLALFSAAVNGDNSGDALIVDSIQRLLAGHQFKTFPLLEPLSETQLEAVNDCDAAIICGTNLYQHAFVCALTPAVLERIRIPIIPLGVGSSAPIGKLPAMNREGVRAVRMVHERCALGSVRDPVSLEFARSLGIRNVELTGCPVLFHGLAEPRFEAPSTDRLFLSIRARLLHVEESWNAKQQATLRRLCREFHPTLVLQSPYDIPIADDLVREFGLASLQDADWQAQSMIAGATQASRVVGFRLHFGMLALAHGKPATFLATDTRTSGFCEMVGVPYHAVQTYRDDDVLAELRQPQPGLERFLVNWRSLRTAMAGLLDANGLSHALHS